MIGLAYKESFEALALPEKYDFKLAVALGYVCCGIVCLLKGFLVEAEEYLLKEIDLCGMVDLAMFDATALQLLGEINVYKKDYRKAVGYSKRAASQRERTGPSWTLADANLHLILARIMNNEKDK